MIPDFYSECENALKAYLLELTDFFTKDWQVSSDDTNIARGADYIIILRPGPFPIFQSTTTGKIKDFDWNIVVDTYVKYVEYKKSWDMFKALRAALFWKLNCNPILACADTTKSATNVWGVTLSSDEQTQYFKFADSPENATPNFIIQTMLVTVRQRIEFDF